MSMPKYKPTKWKLIFCTECNRRAEGWRCGREHRDKYIERENVPFKIPDLQITGHYAWVRAESKKMKEEFPISPTEVTRIIMGPGIKPGGMIPDQWWMWTKKGSSLSLKWLGDDDSNK